jgi:Zn-dependent peptidase ImmA (M78 family)
LLKLDRVELADIHNPEVLVQAIFAQKPDMPIPVPIEEMVVANDIKKVERLSGAPEFVGMLVTDETKSYGQIWIGGDMRSTRQRFTIAHEFGHFLLPHHTKMEYRCRSQDLSQGEKGSTPEAEREWEANRFAAELMLPRQQFIKRLGKVAAPCLSHVERLATAFDMSVEATARRYLNLTDFPCCLIFSRNGVVTRQPARSADFIHWPCISPKQKVPSISTAALQGVGLGDFNEIPGDEWLASDYRKIPDHIQEQTLFQDDGYAITLLWIESAEDEEVVEENEGMRWKK